LHSLLGTAERDPGCEAAFDLFDEYCDLVVRGRPVDQRFAGLVSHIANCTACREDTAALLAAIREEERRGGSR
jgi:hypothetical protein